MGTNRDEYKLFMVMDPEYTSLLGGVKDQQHYDLVAKFFSDGWKAYGADEIAAAIRKSRGRNVYVYRFDWDEESSFLGADFSKMVRFADLKGRLLQETGFKSQKEHCRLQIA